MSKVETRPSITLVTQQNTDRLPGPCPPNTGMCPPRVVCRPRTEGCFPTGPCVPNATEPPPRRPGPPIPPLPRPPVG